MRNHPAKSNVRRAAFRASVQALTASSLALGAALSFSQSAVADTYFTATTGDFNNAANWSAGVPTSGVNADIFSGGTVTIDDNETSNDLNTGGTFGSNAAANGTINMTAGTMTAGANGGWMRLGTANGTSGTINLSGGTLNFVSGGGQFNIGETTGSTGLVNITGGTLNSNNPTGQISVGQGGTTGSGTIDLAAGATLNAQGQMWLGQGTGGQGTFNMTGGTYNQHNWLALGRGGGGALGTLNISGGTLTSDATSNTGGEHFDVGSNTGGTGIVNQTGGTVVVNTFALWMSEGGTATYNLSGANSILTANAGITLGQAGAGTVAMNFNGGTLNLTTFTSGAGTGTKTLNFNGTQVNALASSGTFLGGTSIVANVQAGGFLLNTNGAATTYGNNDTIATVLAHDPTAGAAATDGGVTKTGAGVLTLGGVNTYTGNTTINGGALDAQVAGSVPGLNTAGRVSVGATGALVVGVGYSTGQSVNDIDTARTSNTFAAGGSIGLDLNTGTNATYATNLTPAYTTDFYKLGAGTLTLTGANTYTGTTYLYGGLVNAGTANLGNGGPIVVNNGGIQFATGNTTDYSTRGIVQNGAATFDTNGNNVTFASAITGTGGSLTKAGAGTLTLTGGITLTPTTNAYGNLFVTGGTLTLSGASETINSGGNYSSIGQVPGNFGTLSVINGASYNTTSDFNIADVGGVVGSTTLTQNGGVVNLGAGSTLSVATLYIGKGDPTAAAGTTATNGTLAVGVFNQTGGTFTSTGFNNYGSYGQGQYNLTGGTSTNSGTFNSVARQTGGFGTIDINGGTFSDTAAAGRLIIGEQGTGVVNVRNGGVLNMVATTNASGGNLTGALAAITLGNTTGTGAVGILNLLPGGTVNTPSIGGLNNATTGILNFNGGTLKPLVATTTFIQNLTSANVYSGGAIIDTTNGSATIVQPLVAPAGNGVSSLTAGTATGTFSTTPIVQLTGGGGVGATAVATVNAGGAITGFTITNPGTGYTSAPTVTVTGPSGATSTATATIAANVSGGLTKLGANTLTLTGASTYTGATTITTGTLALGVGGSVTNSSQITVGTTVGTGATFDVSAITFTSPASQTLTGLGTVAGGANMLTLAGTLSPGATPNTGDIGTLTINTTGTLSLTGTTNFDITNAMTKDLITATGANLSLGNGSILTLRGTVTAGTTYTLVSGLTSETGSYTTVNGAPAGTTPTFTFTGGNYNVTFNAVPEPSTWAMGVVGLSLAGLWLRRRRVA